MHFHAQIMQKLVLSFWHYAKFMLRVLCTCASECTIKR